jgi:hypothetical protein
MDVHFFLPLELIDQFFLFYSMDRSTGDETVHLIQTSDWRMSAKLRATLSEGIFVMTRSDMMKVQEASLNRARYDLAILEGIGGSVPSNSSKLY